MCVSCPIAYHRQEPRPYASSNQKIMRTISDLSVMIHCSWRAKVISLSAEALFELSRPMVKEQGDPREVGPAMADHLQG